MKKIFRLPDPKKKKVPKIQTRKIAHLFFNKIKQKKIFTKKRTIGTALDSQLRI